MKTPNTIEQEINEIRLQIYEETKNMTIRERVERVNRIGEAAAKKYGFKRVAISRNISAQTALLFTGRRAKRQNTCGDLPPSTYDKLKIFAPTRPQVAAWRPQPPYNFHDTVFTN